MAKSKVTQLKEALRTAEKLKIEIQNENERKLRTSRLCSGAALCEAHLKSLSFGDDLSKHISENPKSNAHFLIVIDFLKKQDEIKDGKTRAFFMEHYNSVKDKFYKAEIARIDEAEKKEKERRALQSEKRKKANAEKKQTAIEPPPVTPTTA